jgi:hypothetical protein
VGHRHLTGSDRDPNRQLNSRGELAALEGLLHGQRALSGPRRHPGYVAIRRPDREQRVACELHDLAAMLSDQLDQLAEAAVQQLGERFDTARPGSSQPFGEGREAGDVGEQDRRREPLSFRHTQWLRLIHKPPGN